MKRLSTVILAVSILILLTGCFAVGEAAGTAARFKIQENTAFRNIDVQALRTELRKNNCEVDA